MAGLIKPVRSWRESVAIYLHPRVVGMLFLGFSSGLPLLLTLSTLSIWLKEEGVTKTTIGLFALVGMPYALKFLWSPLIDRVPIPLLTPLLGRRRGWAILTQLVLMLAIVGLGSTNPAENLGLTALCALLVAFCSASQDIVVDAYRVEILDKSQYGAGAGMVVMGYRIGMLASGAGALYLASYVGWFEVHAVMAALVTVGIVTILLNPEPKVVKSAESVAREERVTNYLARRPDLRAWQAGTLAGMYSAVVCPFADFMARRGWAVILLFVIFYKFGDSLAGVMAYPFYVELGFSKIEIANISKLFGLAATIIGGFLGGLLVRKFGVMNSLLICGVLQMLSNLLFAVQAMVGHDIYMLTVTIGIENLAGGMGTAAFIAYLMSLCTLAYTMTQYALFSSLFAIALRVFAAPSGWLADQLDWISFFLLTTGAALPGLLLLLWLMRSFRVEEHGAARTPTPAK